MIPETILRCHTRLTFYKRIANAKTADELRELQIEMIDRFGLLPEPTKNLFRITELNLKVEPLGIRKIDAAPKSGHIEFEAEPNIDLKKLIKLIQTQSNIYKLDGAQRLRFSVNDETSANRIALIESLLDKLKKKSKSPLSRNRERGRGKRIFLPT